MSETTLYPVEEEKELVADIKNKKHRDIIWMANGSVSATHSASRGGAMIGFEGFNTRPPSKFNINFVDFPFKKVQRYKKYDTESAFKQYVEIVKEEDPKYAVIPDIDEKLTIEQAYEYAYELQPHCETLIVAPKTIHPSKVPDFIRVGVPCQKKFSEAPWDVEDYRDCEELHLFGGSPHKHYELVFEEGLTNVRSMDTSVPLSSARWGDTWVMTDDGPRWQDGQGGVYGCVESTFINMHTVFNRHSYQSFKRPWVERPEYDKKYKQCGYPDEEVLHPKDDKPFAGREYYETMTYTRY